MKLPFRKKQSQPAPTMPPEVQQYYQAERRERTGIAWLLAIGTLLVTIAIILGLFFGGRWVYHKITHRKNPSTTSQTSSTNTSTSKNPSQGSSNSSNQSSGGSSASSSSSSNTSSSSSSSTTGSSTTSTPSTTSNSKGSSSTGGVVSPTAASTSIPNTGPGDTIAIFFGVTVAGYLAHRLIIVKKR